jgi:hypothetical protein
MGVRVGEYPALPRCRPAVTFRTRSGTSRSTGQSALYNLAQAYRKTGDRERAAELLARVGKLNDAERGDSGDDLKRVVMRLVREGSAAGR